MRVRERRTGKPLLSPEPGALSAPSEPEFCSNAGQVGFSQSQGHEGTET